MARLDGLADGVAFLAENGFGSAVFIVREETGRGAEEPSGGLERPILIERATDDFSHFPGRWGGVRAAVPSLCPVLGSGGDAHFQGPLVHGELVGLLNAQGVGRGGGGAGESQQGKQGNEAAQAIHGAEGSKRGADGKPEMRGGAGSASEMGCRSLACPMVGRNHGFKGTRRLNTVFIHDGGDALPDAGEGNFLRAEGIDGDFVGGIENSG